MKIAVIGLGSMGKRRLRLLHENFTGLSLCGMDDRLDRRKEAESLYNIKTFSNLKEMFIDFLPDAAFICTSPLSHPVLSEACLEQGLHVFSELNLLNENHARLQILANEKKKILFISSTPLFRKEIQYITKEVHECKQPINYIYHVGHYLPDWHPWESYKDFFVSNKRTNACRELLCIELPWLLNAFGEADSFSVVSDNITRLDLEYPDNFIVNIKHNNGNKGVLCLDVIARKAIRSLDVYGEEIFLRWFGTPETLYHYDIENKVDREISLYENIEKNPRYSSNIIENAYHDEIKSFFDCILEGKIPLHSTEADVNLLSTVDAIEAGGLFND